MTLSNTVLEVCRHLRNFFHFDDSANKPHYQKEGYFNITDGNIELDSSEFQYGDWIALKSRRLSGIFRLDKVPPLESPLVPYTVPHFRLANGSDDINPLGGVESLTGAVNLLILPSGFIELCKEINAWVSDPNNAPSAIQSESVIGFFSKTVATGQNGLPLGWEQLFSQRLSAWRRMYTTFDL